MEMYIPKKEKEKLILEAAYRIFSQKGFYNTKVEEIAEAAGVGKGTVYEYFSSKEEIFEKVLQFQVNEFIHRIKKQMDSFTESADVEDKISRLLDIYLGFARENLWLFYALVTEVGKLRPDLKQWMYTARSKIFKIIEEVMLEGKKKGSIRRDLDTQIAVPFILGGIRVSAETFFNMKGNIDYKYWKKHVLDIVLKGMAASTGNMPD